MKLENFNKFLIEMIIHVTYINIFYQFKVLNCSYWVMP
ncbi:hypothetical protein ABIE50_001224 [Chitinophaga sp. OAE865]